MNSPFYIGRFWAMGKHANSYSNICIVTISLQETNRVLDKYTTTYQSLKTMSLYHSSVDTLFPVLYISAPGLCSPLFVSHNLFQEIAILWSSKVGDGISYYCMVHPSMTGELIVISPTT